MKVQFDGPEAECTVFGVTFAKGEATDISKLPAEFQTKLASNPTFSEADGRRKAVVAE